MNIGGLSELPEGRLLDDESFRLAFVNLPIPTLILDDQMMVRAASRSFMERYGLERAQVEGLRCYEVFHQVTMPCPPSRCRFRAALAGQRGCYNLHEYVDKDGRQVIEEVHLAPLLNGNGKVVGVIESIRDVTTAKRLETELTEANEFLNRLLDSMLGAVVAADLTGRILFVNKSAKRVLGWEAHELIGQNLRLLSPSDELRRFRELLQHNGGRVLGLRTNVHTKNSGDIPVRINSSLVYREGRPMATVGIITDLREQIKMERSLTAAQMQVVQSDKLARLGRMAAGLAHELNNPLTGITVYAELLKETLPSDSPAQADLDCIAEDAERCRDIVKGLLNYSRQTEIQVEELELSQVVEDSFNLIRDNATFMHVEVHRHYSETPLAFMGDEKLMRQVFINLLANAVDAMDGRGRLTVTTYLDEEGLRVAEVADSGPGIDPNNLAKVFDPFFTTKAPGKGTGLGLSVVYGVVTRHGGSITVKETGPAGTTFMVRLPSEGPTSLMAFARKLRPNLT